MTLNDYQTLVKRTSANGALPEARDRLACYALGAAGEAGEVADLFKKHLFHGHDLDKGVLQKELGDVLWYLAALCTELGISLESVAEGNVAKMKERYPEGFSVEASKARRDLP